MLTYVGYLNEKRVPKDERIKLLDNDDYLVVVPLTDFASCKYGAFTKWCTSAPGSGASVEETITEDNVLIYVINKKYDKDTSNADEFKWLFDQFENDEIELDELVEFKNEHDDIYNFSKVAVEYNIKFNSYTLWDNNNIELTQESLGLYDMDFDQDVIDAIEEYINKKIFKN